MCLGPQHFVVSNVCHDLLRMDGEKEEWIKLKLSFEGHVKIKRMRSMRHFALKRILGVSVCCQIYQLHFCALIFLPSSSLSMDFRSMV